MAEHRLPNVGDIIWLDDDLAVKCGHRFGEVIEIMPVGLRVSFQADHELAKTLPTTEYVVVGAMSPLFKIETKSTNWERRKLVKELLGHIDSFQSVQSGGDVEALAERTGKLLDHYIARSSQGWCR